MATSTGKLNSIDLCKKCIVERESFVLQGGAGSGKTETLKELLLYIKHSDPKARVICITHTNVAADEILSRVGDKFTVSTIHSFLHSLIKDYKKNIKSVIFKIFIIPEMLREEKCEEITDADYKKAEHEKYKKIYQKHADKLFDIKKENSAKVTGKREYDKDPDLYNQSLNKKIRDLNAEIVNAIDSKDYSKIYYNETKFNSFNDLSYGHDGLLSVFHLLFEKYPVLSKMVTDKYDYIFIDEYQDTNEDIIKDLISISTNYNLTVGLFGDSMQAIYNDGIGDVENFIKNSSLRNIPKPDNYRCSYEVLDIINHLRLDDINQKVVFKRLNNLQFETEVDRHGTVKVLYTVYENKPNANSPWEEKIKYQSQIDALIAEAKKQCENAKILMLTNKSISEKNGFKNLYKVFDDRYIDVSDRIETYLRSIQVLAVCDICQSYNKKQYNSLIKQIRLGGYLIQNINDKKKLHECIKSLVENSELSLWDAVKFAKANKLIKQTETCSNVMKRNNEFISKLCKDDFYQDFKKLFFAGQKTFSRINGNIGINSKEEFDYYLSLYKNEQFIEKLFSNDIKFLEALNYVKYLDEDTEYITMHKTKGSSIPSVIVVMEEFYWNEYDFSLLYSPIEESKIHKRNNSQKLIYVACSRAKESLVCVRILEKDEINSFLNIFPGAKFIEANENI
ncbi:MAG: hypothetical protein BGN88_10250 [Clostridiales bacterium 43-6]|nr:MAG: hypothetical protein BGN88_10250 [Clostridiales bacterium 43-6]